MINFTPLTNRILASSVALLLTASSFGQWINGQPAAKVLGQANLTSNGADLTANRLSWPTQIIVDPTSQKMFVTDFSNNRILRFINAASFANGDPAEAVLGQPNMTTGAEVTDIKSLYGPMSMTLDAAGRLYVADYGNSRVIRYDNAATVGSYPDASVVLGQPDFDTFSPGVSAAKMNTPAGIFINGNTLWVADGGNNRILRFDNASLKVTGAAADAVLGQPDFTSFGAGTAANSLDGPRQVFVTPAGDLWVADQNNNRVLKFTNAAILSPTSPASAVVGQTSFTARVTALTASGLEKPIGVSVDQGNRLYISSEEQNRVLVYENANSIVIGASALFVLGQPNFTTGTPAVTASGLNHPQMLFINNRLWVGDRNNNRVLMQLPSTSSLPLTLIGFKAAKLPAGDIEISWTTTAETNVSDFELQYSTDGVNFNKVINRQNARNDYKNVYAFKHSSSNKANFYRLKMNDKDGSSKLSPVVSVKNATTAPDISISPNPVKGGLIYVRGSDVQQVKVEIYDVAGRLMKAALATTLVQPVDVHELTAGIYTVRISYEGGIVSKQFIKQ